MLLTDVEGVKDGKGNLLSTIHREEIKDLIDQEVIAGGMIPKVRCCQSALDGGVTKTHIIDGRQEHAVLLEIFTPEGIGTEIIS